MPRLAALGGLVLLGDDGPIDGPASRGRNLAMLAILARADVGGVTRDRLAVLLWPESDAERSRHSLDQALYVLRRALGPDAFMTGGATVALDARIVPSDIGELMHAVASGSPEQIVRLYAGPFLDGFHLSGASEFERWVDVERAELHSLYTAALESMARAASAADDRAGAVGHWRRLAAAEPLSSRVALGLMRALAAAGDRAGAIHAARVHEALVRDGLDAPPEPAILAFVDELRRGQERSGAPGGGSGAGDLNRARQVAGPGPAPDPPADLHALAQVSARHGMRPTWLWVAAAVAILVAAVAMMNARGNASAAAAPTVAIVAFTNETGDPAFDPLGRMAADWITVELVRTGLVQVVDQTGTSTADGLVSGRFYRTGDSLWLQARITRPADGAVLRALDAVGAPAPSPATALEPLRQRVLGALGTLYDPRLTTWAATSLRPPSFAAFKEFAAGLELFDFPRDLPGATARFRRASELDPEYVLPQLWLAWAATLDGAWTRADSAILALGPGRDRMSPLERAWHDRIKALLEGDNEASYRAAERMVAIAPPSSGWVIALANAALDTNRPQVAVSALLSAGMENLGQEEDYGWFLLTAAHHQLGDYRSELDATDRAIASVGLDWGFVGPGVPALAALGRIDDLRHRLDELRHRPPLEGHRPAGLASLLAAARELRVHVNPDAAASLVDEYLPDADFAATTDEPGLRARIELMYELGRWQRAEQLLDAWAREADPANLFHLGMSGLLAARRGDRLTAERVADELASTDRPFLFGEPTLWRARIAAVLGHDRNAGSLLRQAFAEGQGGPTWYFLHVARDFDGLRREPSFVELLRPRP